MNTVLRHLRRAALLDRGAGPSDAHLLESFLQYRDEAAFEALLRRHGPMVLGVCRRVLGNRADAEDAFQATFLVLVRKAASVRPRELVGNWLWGVAHRTAMKARSMNAKRRSRERQAGGVARSGNGGGGWVSEELLGLLDRELGRLPEQYRVPVVLCELEGRSRKEVARALGLPEGTLSWRLAQAKKMLARKLSRHGPALSAGAVAAVLSQGAAPAALSASLLQATARAGLRLAAGQALSASVPATVVSLTEGVLKAMLLTKLKVASWAVSVVLLAGAGAVGVTYRAAAQEAPSRAPRPAYAAQQKTRAAPDDLESLRLEIEALRRELRATRDLVKQLQAEVRGKKEVDSRQERDLEKLRRLDALRLEAEKLHRDDALLGDNIAKAGVSRKDAPDPLAELEDAVKRLRQDPKDKRAAEALDRALRRLKERPRPDGAPGDLGKP